MKHTKASSFMDFVKKIEKAAPSLHKASKSILVNNQLNPSNSKSKQKINSIQVPIAQPYSNSIQSGSKQNGISQ